MTAEPGSFSLRGLAQRFVPRPMRVLLRRPRITTRWFSREMLFRLGYRPNSLVRDDWRVHDHPTSVDTLQMHCNSMMSFNRSWHRSWPTARQTW